VVSGKLTYRSYEDKGDNKRYVTEVVVREVLGLRTTNQEKANDTEMKGGLEEAQG